MPSHSPPDPAFEARVRALAKINLGLKILDKRPDGFHELRTVFQTISLGDVLDLEFAPARRTVIEATPDIPDNLVVRAAQCAFDAMRKTGRLKVRLTKKIPMGAGLGGGSSDAAAILLALPVLAGRRLSVETLLQLGAALEHHDQRRACGKLRSLGVHEPFLFRLVDIANETFAMAA